MAVTHAALPSPAPEATRAAAARRIVAGLARSRGRLAAAAADAVICLFLASMWLLPAGQLVSDVGRLACGEGCALVAAAFKVLRGAAISFALVSPVAVLLLLIRLAGLYSEAEQEKAQGNAPTRSRKSISAVTREFLGDPAILGFLASVPFVLLILVGDWLKAHSPVKGSRREEIGSVISDVGFLGTNGLYCFIIIPTVALQLWRAWRMTRPGQ
ncbi:hypothetical protein ACP70R_046284 [Stipagrostis hirtigluma subsp. patula]